MGELITKNDGNLTVELGLVAESEVVNAINYFSGIIEKEYDFAPGMPYRNEDCAYLELYKGDICLTVGWDELTGIYITSDCNEGNEYIQLLAQRFDYGE